jgi:hypothetical protein
MNELIYQPDPPKAPCIVSRADGEMDVGRPRMADLGAIHQLTHFASR